MKNTKTKRMVQMAILVAIMLIFAFTPLGYFKAGAVEITFMIIPVAIGAIVLGPAAGAILGGVFGITSFIQCFGMSPFGTFIFSLNPWICALMCIIPRVLCGYLSGLVFKALVKIDKTKIVSYFAASMSTAILNTVFFMLSIILFFWKNEAFISQMTGWGMPTDAVWPFLVAFVGVNGVIEAVVGFIIGGGIAKAVNRFSR